MVAEKHDALMEQMHYRSGFGVMLTIVKKIRILNHALLKTVFDHKTAREGSPPK